MPNPLLELTAASGIRAGGALVAGVKCFGYRGMGLEAPFRPRQSTAERKNRSGRCWRYFPFMTCTPESGLILVELNRFAVEGRCFSVC
jgi:hypothetical protein